MFVGGSLVPAGGHNPIEPAASGRAIVFGPHMENFADVARELVARGAAIQVPDADALEETLAGLMRDGDAAVTARGRGARSVVDRNLRGDAAHARVSGAGRQPRRDPGGRTRPRGERGST